jgi:hypothetical protein
MLAKFCIIDIKLLYLSRESDACLKWDNATNINIFNHMKKVFEESTVPPRHGYISELAKLCNCNRKTVSRALFEGQAGKKSDLVRKIYKSKYK